MDTKYFTKHATPLGNVHTTTHLHDTRNGITLHAENITMLLTVHETMQLYEINDMLDTVVRNLVTAANNLDNIVRNFLNATIF